MKKIFGVGFVVLGFVTIAACRGGSDTGTFSSGGTSSGFTSSSGGKSSGGASSGATSGGEDPGSFECPAVGDKNCPNDEAATQSSVDACERCRTEFSAYVTCIGGTPSCGPDGKSVSTSSTACEEQQSAVVQCVLRDAGS